MTNIRGKRFVEVLKGYHQENQIPLQTLASHLDTPLHTLKKWLGGASLPTHRSVIRACRKLGWNPASFDAPQEIFRSIYHDKFLTLDGIAARFTEFNQGLSVNALSLVPVAAALAYGQLWDAGIKCRLECRNYQAEIQLLHPHLADKVIKFQGDLLQGRLVFSVFSELENPMQLLKPDWLTLADQTFQILVRDLQKFSQ